MALQPVTVQLTTPIKDFGKTLEALTISREVNGGDLLEIDGLGAHASTLTLISRLCGISFEAVKQMSIRDIKATEKAMAPFAGIGR